MRHLHLAAVIIPVLLLSACGGGNPPPAQPATPTTSSEAAASTPPTTNVAAPADDKALAPLFGTWGLDPANCGEQVLKISKTRFEGPGSGCDIASFTDNGDGSYTASVSCTAKGQSAKEKISMRPIFTPTGEGIDLVYMNRNNEASEVLRCDVPRSK